MRWPGKIPADSTCDQILGNIDMLPTFASLAGAILDADRTIDGVDVSSLLFYAAPKAARDTHLYYSPVIGQVSAIRQGDWKLFIRTPAGKRDEGDKTGPNSGPALYNLKTDEAEKRNAEIMTNQRPAGVVVRSNN
jgi:arylsulfatase A